MRVSVLSEPAPGAFIPGKFFPLNKYAVNRLFPCYLLFSLQLNIHCTPNLSLQLP